MPEGQVLHVTLNGGLSLDGTLAETQDHRFGLRVNADPAGQKPGRRTAKRWVEYDDVVSLSGEGIQVATSETALASFVRIGGKARVHTSTGELVEGRIDEYDGATLRIDERRLSLAEGDVVRIDIREGDSLLNGTLIGLGIGAGWAALALAACNDPDCGEAVPFVFLFTIGIGTGVGALADAFNTRSTTIYTGALTDRRLTIAPLLSRDKKGILVSFRF
jgi:hypothetical protein